MFQLSLYNIDVFYFNTIWFSQLAEIFEALTYCTCVVLISYLKHILQTNKDNNHITSNKTKSLFIEGNLYGLHIHRFDKQFSNNLKKDNHKATHCKLN